MRNKIASILAVIALALGGVVVAAPSANAYTFLCQQYGQRPVISGPSISAYGAQSCTGEFQSQTVSTQIQVKTINRVWPFPDSWARVAYHPYQRSSASWLGNTARGSCLKGIKTYRTVVTGTARWNTHSATSLGRETALSCY